MENTEQPGVGSSILKRMTVQFSIVLGHKKFTIEELMKLGPGSVVQLDRGVEDLVDIFVNEKLIARAQLVVVDGKMGVTLKELVE